MLLAPLAILNAAHALTRFITTGGMVVTGVVLGPQMFRLEGTWAEGGRWVIEAVFTVRHEGTVEVVLVRQVGRASKTFRATGADHTAAALAALA
jgi:hypothetical protein